MDAQGPTSDTSSLQLSNAPTLVVPQALRPPGSWAQFRGRSANGMADGNGGRTAPLAPPRPGAQLQVPTDGLLGSSPPPPPPEMMGLGKRPMPGSSSFQQPTAAYWANRNAAMAAAAAAPKKSEESLSSFLQDGLLLKIPKEMAKELKSIQLSFEKW